MFSKKYIAEGHGSTDSYKQSQRLARVCITLNYRFHLTQYIKCKSNIGTYLLEIMNKEMFIFYISAKIIITFNDHIQDKTPVK